MSYADFAIFRQGTRARATRVLIPAGGREPSAFRYEGRLYLPSHINLCNGDHLLNTDRELMGFTFLLGGDTEVGRGRLARDCENAENEAGSWLKFFLAADRRCRNDGCQLIYPLVYADDDSDHIILVQECPGCWAALGFRLASPPVPEALFETTPTQ
jgi:hypothetical protein